MIVLHHQQNCNQAVCVSFPPLLPQSSCLTHTPLLPQSSCLTHTHTSHLQQWHRRYFVLWSTKLMEYYTTSEKKPTDYCKTIDLSKCEDMLAPVPTNNRTNVIKLIIQKPEDKKREYLLDCESKEEMQMWLASFAEVCGFEQGESIARIRTDLSSQSQEFALICLVPRTQDEEIVGFIPRSFLSLGTRL